MFVRWQLFPYFYFLLSLPLLSFSSLSNIPYLTFMKVIVSSSISPLFSFFLPIYSLSLSVSLSFSICFVHWLGTKSNTWQFKNQSLRYLFHITSLALSYFTCNFFLKQWLFHRSEEQESKNDFLCLSKNIYMAKKKSWERLCRFFIFSYRWRVQTYNFCL